MWRRTMGVVVAIAVAVAVALQWLPPKQEEASHAARASTPIEITLALRADGLAVEVERGDLTLTLQF